MGAGNASVTFLAALQSLSAAASKPLNELTVAAIERGALKPAAEAPVPEEPAELLNQIALDPELEKALQPVLLQLGFEIKSEEILDQFTYSRTVSVASGKESRFYFVCLPKSVLAQPGDKNENLGAVSLLGYLFAKNSLVYIISRDLSVMDLTFDGLMDRWADMGIKTSFIPWPHVEKFLAAKTDETRNQWVKQILKLAVQEGATTRPVAAPTPLTPGEQDEVVRILIQQAKDPFLEKPQDYLNDLVSTADLPDGSRLKGSWKGDPRIDAKLLVRVASASNYPTGHPRADENQLGWVLKAIFDKALSPKDSEIVLKIILNHNLIRDPQTLQALRFKESPGNTGAFSA